MREHLLLPYRYRVCFNQAPHRPDWYTVERLWVVKKLFRKPTQEWKPYRKVIYASMVSGVIYRPFEFPSRDAAMAFINEDRKPPKHECEEVAGPFG